MTNMWPYLRLRRQELAQRRGMYEASFLSRVFERNRAIISPRLWTSPDHEHQAMMVVRCALMHADECLLTLVLKIPVDTAFLQRVCR